MVVIRKRTKAKQTLCAPQGTARPPSTMRPPPPDQKESRPTPDLKRTQRKNSRQPTPATKGWGGGALGEKQHTSRNTNPTFDVSTGDAESSFDSGSKKPCFKALVGKIGKSEH